MKSLSRNTHQRSNCTPILLVLMVLLPCSVLAGDPVSGYELLSEQLREIQDDDFQNPGMEIVEQGRERFSLKALNDKSCESCHGEDGKDLDLKKIASYPRYYDVLDKPFTLREQIQYCQEVYLDDFPFMAGDPDLVAMETYVRYLARGEPVNVDINGPMKKWYEEGEKLYRTRYGLMDVSCAHCHDYYAGQMLRGQKLSQGQSNGFPEYRFHADRVYTFPQRVKECFRSFRAEAFEYTSDDMKRLEIYVNARGNGLPIETPAIRY